ncbi:unnamed protein product, partial [Durusdinium trenchii]
MWPARGDQPPSLGHGPPSSGHTPCTHRERHAGLGRWSRAASAVGAAGLQPRDF